MSQFVMPALTEAATWSIMIRDGETGEVLAEHDATTQCETASIGKIFLLIRVATLIEQGELDPASPVIVPEEYAVADSGLLYRMRAKHLCVDDMALLVGAFSDNLATNALIYRCGLQSVRDVAPSLGYANTSLHDYLRDERTPDMPWTPSYGTALELSDLMLRLARGEIVSTGVSATVLSWLASDADTSMLADSLLLDPLAHVDAEYQGITLRHKTGTTDFARIDVGHASGPGGSVAYAVAANWRQALPNDLRAPVLDAMRDLGEQVRARITGLRREETLT
ncbi:serine hydrolase [Leucobacter chinensis]|uniref:serine hydrolase n=1 Tax=Leucobacter chinensis TaxID=2851010 RepID=UPI0020B6DAEE|nr:serine hydrolase [Leucobacter chinensis]